MKTHGLMYQDGKKRPEYNVWQGMKNRCYDKTHPRYSRYGARGISVCERWLKSFENFITDMGERPTSKHSIDRINNDGNYEPSNCRWATIIEQANNRANNRVVEFNGEKKTIVEWANYFGIDPTTIYNRICEGWSEEDAIKTPTILREVGKDKEVESLFKSGKSIKEIASLTSLKYQTIVSKINSLRKRGLV